MTPKLKRCKRCQEMVYLWSKGRCKNCTMKDKMEEKREQSSDDYNPVENDEVGKGVVRLGGKKKKPSKSYKPIKKISAEAAHIKKLYSIVIKKIAEERDPVCSGCGQTQFLSFSHIIPRSLRPDLICVKSNIAIHCMQGIDGADSCHDKCEKGMPFWDTMLDGEYIKQYTKENDIIYHRRKMNL